MKKKQQCNNYFKYLDNSGHIAGLSESLVILYGE